MFEIFQCLWHRTARIDGAYASVIPKFIDMMAKGVAPKIFGDGLQTRDLFMSTMSVMP